MFLYLACPASISLAICGVGHPLTIIIWFNKVVVVVVVNIAIVRVTVWLKFSWDLVFVNFVDFSSICRNQIP